MNCFKIIVEKIVMNKMRSMAMFWQSFFLKKGKKQKGFKQLQSNKDTITRWATT